MPVSLKSRFPQIVAELKPRVDVALRDVADQIVADAKARVPVATGRLRDAIHVEKRGVADYEVKGGNDDAWYGHLVEDGTSRTSPHPFLVPAAEAHREVVASLGREALGRL